MSRVYCGNLGRDVTERDLEDEFGRFGRVTSCWISREGDYAFIEFGGMPSPSLLPSMPAACCQRRDRVFLCVFFFLVSPRFFFLARFQTDATPTMPWPSWTGVTLASTWCLGSDDEVAAQEAAAAARCLGKFAHFLGRPLVLAHAPEGRLTALPNRRRFLKLLRGWENDGRRRARDGGDASASNGVFF